MGQGLLGIQYREEKNGRGTTGMADEYVGMRGGWQGWRDSDILKNRLAPMPPPPRPERLTLWLLLLALSTLFLCSFDKGYLYRPGHHDWNTAMNLVVAENLASDHGFLLFRGRRPGSGDAPEYKMYSRFPVGGYALIKLAILPFGNDLSARILAARMLMLLLFSAAVLLAFLALARITSHRWTALAATLAAFSSFYMLLYSNAVSVEMSVDLFAVMLVFHGMVVFVQEGRFRQLLARTCVALLLGWHVYAFLLPFLILGLASEAMGAWKDGTALWPRVRSTGAAVLRSRYTALGVFALLFGAAVLGFNFANEYAAFGGETRVTELPSVQSMLRRTGLDQNPDAPFDPGWWLRFLRQQFFRVCVSSVPFVLTDRGVDLLDWFSSAPFGGPDISGLPLWVSLLALLMVVAASTTVVRLAGPLLDGRRRMLLATLALSGFFWALLMRHNAAHHNYEALFYAGVPLVFYSLLLLYLHKRWGPRPVVGLAVAALLAFVVSTFQMDHRLSPGARVAEAKRATLAEIGSIRETTRERWSCALHPSSRAGPDRTYLPYPNEGTISPEASCCNPTTWTWKPTPAPQTSSSPATAWRAAPCSRPGTNRCSCMIPQVRTTWWSSTEPFTGRWCPESLWRAPTSTSISVAAR